MTDPANLTRDELIARNEELQARCDQLVRILGHLLPDRSGTFFICGKGGTSDEHGLPKAIQVCPRYGVDWSVFYQRVESRAERVAVEVQADGAALPSEDEGLDDGHG
jgi:hypothetical protein